MDQCNQVVRLIELHQSTTITSNKPWQFTQKLKTSRREELMKSRIDFEKALPTIYKTVLPLENHVRASNLEPQLLELVRMRSSQLNGCAYCLDMHSKDARAAGETEQRLYGLDAWRETPYYSPRERAALEWTEAVTLIADNHVPDELYAEVSKHFNEQEMLDLTLAVTSINTWNRLSIAFRAVPGTYQPARSSATAAR